MSGEYDYLFKFILVGASNTGKSCLLLRFLEGRFKNQHQPTLGVQFGTKNIVINNKTIKVQVWDTAGQEYYRCIARAYYRSSIAALLIFDLSSQASFESLEQWIKEVKSNSHRKLRVCLVGSKSDLKKEREVSSDNIQQFKKKHAISCYFETSALKGSNCEQPFFAMSQAIMTDIERGDINPELEGAALGIKINPRIAKSVRESIISFSELRERSQRKERQECRC